MLNFTVGPVMSDPEIIEVANSSTPYFRTPEFSEVMKENERLFLEFLNAPKGSRAVFLTASGTGSMETAVMNVLNDEDKVIVIHQILTTDFKRPDGPSLKVRVEPGGSMPLTIVDGVESAVMPTPEEINSVEVLKPNSPEAARYGEKGKNGIVVITTKSRKPTSTTIYIIDGQKSTEADMKALEQNKIKSVDVVRGKAAKKYNDDQNVGEVIVKTKK